MTDDLSEIIKKPPVWFDESKNIWNYRASSLGMCTAALIFARLEYDAEPFPQWLRDKMQASSKLEDQALYKYVTEYVNVYENSPFRVQDQVDCVLPIDDELQILGHCDARVDVYLTGDDSRTIDSILVEIKSVGEVLYNKFQQGKEYVTDMYQWQIAIYMLSWPGLPLVLFIFPKDENGQADINKDPITYYYDEPPIDLKEIEAKIQTVEAAVISGIPQECDGSKQYPCPFFKHHIKPEKETLVIGDNERQERDEYIRELISELSETKTHEDKLKQELQLIARDRKNLQAELFEFMREHGDPKVVRAGGIEVEKVNSSSSKTDWERLEADAGIKKDDYIKKTYYSYPKVRIL